MSLISVNIEGFNIVRQGLYKTLSKSYCYIYENVYQRMYGYVMYKLGYGIVKNNQVVDSLVIKEEDIKILSLVSEGILPCNTNVKKYLRHHIMKTDDEFENQVFNNPVVVYFKYNNEKYRICLKKLMSKNTEQTNIKKEPKFLSAIIKK